LPTPAPPVTSTSGGRPASACAKASSRRRSSAVRPTKRVYTGSAASVSLVSCATRDARTAGIGRDRVGPYGRAAGGAIDNPAAASWARRSGLSGRSCGSRAKALSSAVITPAGMSGTSSCTGR
jgi:hypothetical protein